jgi:DNA-binding transcriptional ArsR family regulator
MTKSAQHVAGLPAAAAASPQGELASAAQARLLFQPLRLEILQQLAAPHSCSEVGEALGCTAQRVHYHVKALEAAGLVRRVGERKVRALTEGIYQAAARHFWPGAALLHSLGGLAGAQDALSKSYLLGLAEELGSDAARLALGSAAELELPTLSLSAQVALADPRRRSAFLHELQLALRHIAEKYGAGAGAAEAEEYKLVLACYPAPPDMEAPPHAPADGPPPTGRHRYGRKK